MCDSPTAIHLHGCPKRSRQRNKTRSHVEREIVFSQWRWTVTCCIGFAYCLYSALSIGHYWYNAREEMWDFHSISVCIYRCISINYNVEEKFIYFSNSTQIVKLGPNFVYTLFGKFSLREKKTDWSIYFFNFESKLSKENFGFFDVREKGEKERPPPHSISAIGLETASQRERVFMFYFTSKECFALPLCEV